MSRTRSGSRLSRISISFTRKTPQTRANSFGGNLQDFGIAAHKNNEYSILFEGYMHKKGEYNKAWKKRYCILYEDGKIAYYKKEGDTEPAGYVDLSKMNTMVVYLAPETIVHNARKLSLLSEKRQKSIPLTVKYQSKKGDDRTFGFEIDTPDRLWEFRANDMNEQKQWIDHVRDCGFGRPIHQGSLKKADKRLMSWTERYFVLFDNNKIRYFEKDNLENPKNIICLNFCTTVQRVNNQYQGHPYCVEISTTKPDRIWVLEAAKASDRNEWFKAIKHVMQQNLCKFVPEHDGYLSQYMPESKHFIDNYFAIYRTQNGDAKLYCFPHQIGFKQLERGKIYGRKQMEAMIKNNTNEKLNIDLKRLVSVEVYSKFKFENTNPERKENPSSKVIALNINNEYKQYFCLRTQNPKTLDQWVCEFQKVSIGGYKPWYSHLESIDYADQQASSPSNSQSKERLDMMMRLKKEKYDDWMIAEAIKAYENSNATTLDGHYDYGQIKNLLKHIEANVYSTNDERSDAEVKQNDDNTNTNTPTFGSSTGYSFGNSGNNRTSFGILKSTSRQPRLSTTSTLGLSISMTGMEQKSYENDDDALFDENYDTWTTREVINWFQTIDDGWLLKYYGFDRFHTDIVPKIKNIEMNGKQLKKCNDMNLKMLGFKEANVRKKILEHIEQLGAGLSLFPSN